MSSVVSSNAEFLPPPHPPPILSADDIHYLAYQGFLPIQLSADLNPLYDKLFSAISDFFDKPLSEKRDAYPPAHGTELGYYTVEGEKEYLTLRHHEHESSELEKVAAEVWRKTAILLHRIIVGLSLFLNIAPQAWETVLDGCLEMSPSMEEASPTLLRMFKYQPNSGIAETHTDNGLLTLCVGGGKGLQVLDNCDDFRCNECWTDAAGPTILIGSTLRALSQNRVRAGYHRVVANPQGRYSVVFTLRPCIKHTIDLTTFGGYGTVTMKDFWKGLQASKFNVNAKYEIRNKQKQEQAERANRQNRHKVVDESQEAANDGTRADA